MIIEITKRDGVISSNIEEIVAKIFNHYKNLLGSTVIRRYSLDTEMVKGRVVPREKKNWLVDQVTIVEINNALNDIEDDKVPGLMGSVLWFQECL